jgi:FKBP-type peptidyl-prolyl cis-trans isomerase FklB
MRIGIKMILAALLGLPLAQMPARADDQPAFKDERDKASYAIGMDVGASLKRGGFDVNLDVLMNGMKDVLNSRETKLTDQQVRETLTAYQEAMRKSTAEKNRKEGEAFLAENAKKEGVKVHTVTLPNGTNVDFQYKVIAEGTNPPPKNTDVVTFNYRGTLINGKEFDSSTLRGRPAQVAVRYAFVPGLSEALQLMNVGSKWIIYLPSSLAYKDYPSGRDIQAGSTLIWEVELLKSEPAPAGPNTPRTSEIIRVPSAEEMKKGAKPEMIKPEDVEKTNAMLNAASRTNKN